MALCSSFVLFIRDIVRFATFCTAFGGAFLVWFGWQHVKDAKEGVETVDQLWFPLLLISLGVLLLTISLLASCFSCEDRVATVHLYNGATLVLLPLEAALAALWLSNSKLLRQWAWLDPTGTFNRILDGLAAHKTLVTVIALAWASLQCTALLLGSCVGCCIVEANQRRRWKHPWSKYWEEGAQLEEPLLPQASRAGATSSAGYRTPTSQFSSPNFSPERPPRTVHFSSPQRGFAAGQHYEGQQALHRV